MGLLYSDRRRLSSATNNVGNWMERWIINFFWAVWVVLGWEDVAEVGQHAGEVKTKNVLRIG